MSSTKKTKQSLDLSPEEFKALGGKLMNWDAASSGSVKIFKHQCVSNFGADPAVILNAWKLIGEEEELSDPQHKLWAILLLTQYSSDSDLAGKSGSVHEDTFWKWAWHSINLLASLESDVVRSSLESMCFFKSTMISLHLLLPCFYLDYLGESI
jgi:hypothetical protein